MFDVHMPLLYGEGTKAFLRLQEEILLRNNELTILAWGLLPNPRWGFLHITVRVRLWVNLPIF